MPLSRRQSALGAVPLPLKRRHHQIDEEVVKRLVSISGCQTVLPKPSALTSSEQVTQSPSVARGARWVANEAATASVNACQDLRAGMAYKWQACQAKRFASLSPLHNAQTLTTRHNPSLQSALGLRLQCVELSQHCTRHALPKPREASLSLSVKETASAMFAKCLLEQTTRGKAQRCQSALSSKAERIVSPCRFVALVLPKFDAPPKPSVCKPPPPSNRLHLPLSRSPHVNPKLIPLPLNCWHEPVITKPRNTGIIMYNQITITIDDKAFDALALSLQTDDQSALWQGSIELAPKDFDALKLFERKIGDEPIVIIDINGYQWRMMLERDVRDKRQHAAHGGKSYQIPMRSVTAKLGADYAKPQTRLIDGSRYARQIADELLENTGFKIGNWLIADWFVPENTYSLGGKTLIATLADIAEAAGGFVESDHIKALLHLKPRYPKPAWQTQSPSHTLPASLIQAISGNTRQSALLNGVRVIPQSGGNAGYITREGTDGSPEAPDQVHPLYTDQPVWLAKATQVLSDSGVHKIETVETFLHQKQGARLAELGEVWQIEEIGESWHGIVRGVQIEARGFEVRQSITLDRFQSAL
ncbi:MAG: hypothetical protein Q4B71_00285 [Cardiobacteriaceae bacterium]|nr:hypothetical protein [Cardiobacteriaceae bacterium]